MRTTTSIVFVSTVALATGCAVATESSRGVTRSQLAGSAPLAFTNATPDPMCSLRIEREGERSFGDNWLPSDLPSGKSIDLKLKPGTYMATWNTCKQGGRPYHAGTLTGQNAFTIKDSRDQLQLFAYIADTVAPTKRAAPRDFYTMVKFQGQTVGEATEAVAAVATKAEVEKEQPPQPTERVDMSAFVDKSAAKKRKPIKASLDRKLDLGDRRVGYAERTR